MAHPSKSTALPLMAIVLMLFGLVTITTAPSASASHFRANQITWHQGTGNTVEFHVDGSWRCTFYLDPCSAVVGDTLSSEFIDYGDGNSDSLSLTITGVDVANDVVSASGHIEHTYATTGPFTAAIENCCRLSGSGGHINNPDGSVRFATLVDLSEDSASPESLVAPIVDCPLEAACSFTVPAVDTNGQELRWRLATSEEAGDGSDTFAQPTGATINATTGLYSWDTTGAVLAPSGSTFYSTQVIVENVVAGVTVSSIPVDFFIRLGSNSTNAQPVFESPTPADGSVVTGSVGAPLTFQVQASDPDAADTVTLNALGSPAGATLTGSPGNPASSTFTWTPSAPGDTLLTLVAADQNGLGAVPRGIILRVTAGTNPPPIVDAGPPVSGDEGAAIPITGTATDTETLTTTWSATPGAGVDAGATCTFANPAALSTTVSCTDDGSWTLSLGADDGTNPAVTDTTDLTVANVNPVVTITSPVDGSSANAGSAVALAAPFTDAGSNDTHTCSIDWGDGTVEPGTVSTGTCTGSHTYAAAGALPITVTVTDDDEGAGSASLSLTITDGSVRTKILGGGLVHEKWCGTTYFALGAFGSPLRGELQLATGRNWFHARGISAIAVTGTTSTWSGTGHWNGKPGYTFTAWIQDNGNQGQPLPWTPKWQPRKKAPADTFAIVIYSPRGKVVHSAAGAVKHGNILIR